MVHTLKAATPSVAVAPVPSSPGPDRNRVTISPGMLLRGTPGGRSFAAPSWLLSQPVVIEYRAPE